MDIEEQSYEVNEIIHRRVSKLNVSVRVFNCSSSFSNSASYTIYPDFPQIFYGAGLNNQETERIITVIVIEARSFDAQVKFWKVRAFTPRVFTDRMLTVVAFGALTQRNLRNNSKTPDIRLHVLDL